MNQGALPPRSLYGTDITAIGHEKCS